MEFNFASKSFGAEKILNAASFVLADGFVTALLGPSGIGKTTLARMIAGLETDDAGQIHRVQKIGFVFQEPRLMPWLTVKENIELVAPENGWLNKLGLTGTDALYPRQLSLGMSRRVALARAFASAPELLILDEPFASMDKETAAQVKDTLKILLQETKVTALIVTHDLADAKTFSANTMNLAGRPAQLS